MNISSDYTSTLASVASGMKGEQIQQQVAIAVLKQTQDAQQQFAKELIAMMSSGPTLQGTGRVINVAA